MLRLQLRRFSASDAAGGQSYRQLINLLKGHAPIDVHPEVEEALHAKKPVVALETTIVTHGMPYPTNLETARSVERIVRSTGSVPATIGVIQGRVKIGLQPSQLERLAHTARASSVVKLSRRDLGPAIALQKDGGTTCSTTLIFAALAGIKVFATGGLGGVHRGGENSMDVSADLHELARCPVGLVSAGVKSILDIGRTLEYLETLGVPVISYSETNDFPAFYSRYSGFQSPWKLNDPLTAAQVVYSQRQLGMDNGTLFAVPIPEEYEAVGQELQTSVVQAVREAEENGVNKRGKEVTPWLLKRVGELTQGKSLQSNVALIENTALVAGQIAREYSKLVQGHPEGTNSDGVSSATALKASIPTSDSALISLKASENLSQAPAKLVVVGSAAVDITAQAKPVSEANAALGLHSTSPGSVSLSLGGVARNVAEAAHRTLASQSPDGPETTVLVSPIGQDSFGRLLSDEMRRMKMRTDGLLETVRENTAVCNMVLDSKGNLLNGVAAMDITLSLEGQKALDRIMRLKPQVVALDANLSAEVLSILVRHCEGNNITTFFEPTSVIKSTAILPAISRILGQSEIRQRSPITFASPNLLELAQIYQSARAEPLELMARNYWWRTVNTFGLGSEFRSDLEHLARRPVSDQDSSNGTLSFLLEKGIAQMAVNLLPFFQHLIIKCGNLGVLVVMRSSKGKESAWAKERSNIHGRYIVARPPSGKEVVVLKHVPPLIVDEQGIVNVTGAGDSLVGSILASIARNVDTFEDPGHLETAMQLAQRAAVATLGSSLAVSPSISEL